MIGLRKSILIFLLSWYAGLSGATTVVLSAQQAVERALKHSRDADNIRMNKVLSENAYSAGKERFLPQWSATADYSNSKLSGQAYHSTVGITQKFHSGGSLGLTYQPYASSGFAASLSLTQPLLRGFNQGFLTAASVDDAYYQAKLARINQLNSLVTAVLSSYWAVIQAKQNYIVQHLGYQQAQQTYQQYQIKVKAGQKPRMALIAQRSQLLTYKLGLLTQKNNIDAAVKDLLLKLNLPEDVELKLDTSLDISRYATLPPTAEAIRHAQQHNVAIALARLAVAAAKRGLSTAQNNLLPKLDLTGSVSSSGDRSTAVQLSLPLDNQNLHSAFVAAKITYRKALLNLKISEESNRKKVTSLWRTLHSELEQMQVQKEALKFSKKNYELTVIKNSHGMESALDVTIKQQAYTAAQQALINLKISYLKNLVQFNQIQGKLLKMWNVQT